jgi:nucleotide-binding universal stress UspA family protein
MKTSALEHGSVLVAIDDSTATWKAVDYVADLAKTKPDVCIHLLHAAAYPPALQESRGAENPNEEEQVEKDLERKQERWEQGVQSAAARLFDKARAIFERAGAAHQEMESHVLTLAHREDLIDDILKSAHEFDCRTIVVGRNCFPWFKEVFVDHLADEISRRASDIAVKVID